MNFLKGSIMKRLNLCVDAVKRACCLTCCQWHSLCALLRTLEERALLFELLSFLVTPRPVREVARVYRVSTMHPPQTSGETVDETRDD